MKTFILALCALALVISLCSCAGPTAPDDSWSPAYDADWNAVVACWGVEPEKPRVTVRQDCESRPGFAQDFNIGNALTGDVWVYGRTVGNSVEVCPDLAALRHEFSEWVKYDAPGGHAYLNGSGKCWL